MTLLRGPSPSHFAANKPRATAFPEPNLSFAVVAQKTTIALAVLACLCVWSPKLFADETVQFKGYNLGCPVDDKSGNILVGPDMDKDGKPAPEIDKNGNKVEVYCIGSNPHPPRGAFYIKFTPAGKEPVYIGLCKYNWGENVSKKMLDKDGVITTVTHTNDEGTTGHRGINTHDDKTHGLKDGFEEKIEFVYTVADGKLGLKLSSRPIKPVIGPDGQPVLDDGNPASHGEGDYKVDKEVPPTQAPNSMTGLLNLVDKLKPPSGRVENASDPDTTIDQEGLDRVVSTIFDGTAQGDGTVSVQFNPFGLKIAEATFPGESSAEIITNLATKINNVDYLKQQGIKSRLLQEEGNQFLLVENVLDADLYVATTDNGIMLLQIGSTL